MERAFSILIHKSFENYMGPTSLFVERSGSAICLILSIKLHRWENVCQMTTNALYKTVQHQKPH